MGTLRTVDLFVTTPDYKPIQDFQIVNFVSVDMNKRREMEEFYNDGVLTDEMADELLANLEAQMPKTVTDSITEAFGDVKETKERLKNLDFDDLL